MENQPKETIKQLISELLSKMDFEGQVEVDDSSQEILLVKIESDEAGFLIGQNGMNLAAFQHLARAIANRKLGQNFVNFVVDVNNYRANRLELLKDMALDFAKEVAENRQPKILEPMSAYERRIIHVALSNYPGLKTESQGEGEERRVVIKPANDSSS